MRFSEIEELVAAQLDLPVLAVRQARRGRLPKCHQDVGIARELIYTIAKMDGRTLARISKESGRHTAEISRDITRYRRRVIHNSGYAAVLQEIVKAAEMDTPYHCCSCGQRLAYAPSLDEEPSR